MKFCAYNASQDIFRTFELESEHEIPAFFWNNCYVQSTESFRDWRVWVVSSEIEIEVDISYNINEVNHGQV